MKKFGDLQRGDNVYLIMTGPEWGIRSLRVLEIKNEINDIKLILNDNSWSGYYTKHLISGRSNSIWADKEEALKVALRLANNERSYLSDKIDNLISQYDKIEKFIEEYEQ